jgi:hypothetical protein
MTKNKNISKWEMACICSKKITLKDLDPDIRDYYEKTKELVPLDFFKAIQVIRSWYLKKDKALPLVNQVPGFHPAIRSF